MNGLKIEKTTSGAIIRQKGFFQRLGKDLSRNRYIYYLSIPVIAFYVIFHYLPLYGAIIAFKDFEPMAGILGSKWIGFKHFIDFFDGVYFTRVLRNTFMINIYSLIFGFPIPIILALLFNEIRNSHFKKISQTISYLPHFISTIVVCGMVIDFTSTNGVFNDILAVFGTKRENLLTKPELFQPIYVMSGIWQSAGWSAIIYLAALSGINPELYEAAVIDGANRWKQTIYVTLPGIMPVIIIMLILRLGEMMNVGYEKIILLYNPTTYETADVISSFVYRRGLLNFDYSFSTAVGLFNSVINFTLLVSANWLSRKLNETSLW